MREEKDFLLAIHMAKEKEDIYLSKNREVVIFKEGQAVSSFYLSKKKIDSLTKLFSNIIETKKNDDTYALYSSDETIVRENDEAKIKVISNHINKIGWDTFLESYQDVSKKDEEIAELIDRFDCVFSQDLEKIISFSTYGVEFSDVDAKLYSLDEMLNSEDHHEDELLLVIGEYEGNLIAYKCSERYFVKLEDGNIINKSTLIEEINVDLGKDIDVSIMNIDEQLEKLSIGTIKKIDLPDEESLIAEKTITVDGTEVNVKMNESSEFDLGAIVDLVEDKIDELLRKQDEAENKQQVAKIKTNLEKMTLKNEEARAKIREKEAAKKTFRLDIADSLKTATKNFAFNLNETAKLVVKHLPFYENKDSLSIIAVPQVELNDYSIVEGFEIDLGRIVLKVLTLDKNKVVFEVLDANLVVDSSSLSLKEGRKLEFNFGEEKSYRLNKEGAMESWALSVEKASIEKELRTIEYGRLMKLMRETETYRLYSEIEKHESKTSLMLFLYFVMRNNDTAKLEELREILKTNETLYEEFITAYNIENSTEERDSLASFNDKKKYVDKLNFVKGLVDSNCLEYPRYIFGQHRFFERDSVMLDYINYRNETLSNDAFRLYLEKVFAQYKLYEDLDDEGRGSLIKCLDYLSSVYKDNPVYGETVKYEIEKHILTNENEEDLSLLISKICGRGITDYNEFKEYEYNIQELYRKGELKYPIHSEKFEVGSIKGEI